MKQKRKLDLGRELAAVPLKNEQARVIRSDEDVLVLGVNLRYRGLPASLVRLWGLKRERKYLLDGLSREIYLSLDGRKTVEDLIDLLTERHKLTFFEGRALLQRYLQLLMKRGLIAVAVR